MYVKFPPQPPAGREPSETCQAGNIPSINIYNVSTHYRSYKGLVRLGKQAKGSKKDSKKAHHAREEPQPAPHAPLGTGQKHINKHVKLESTLCVKMKRSQTILELV